MIRRALEAALRRTAKQYPVVTLTGPRQSGKTTLVRAAFPRHEYASLEDPDRRAFALEDPRGFLGQFAGPVILDEVQRAADLFSYVQTRVDEDDRPRPTTLAAGLLPDVCRARRTGDRPGFSLQERP